MRIKIVIIDDMVGTHSLPLRNEDRIIDVTEERGSIALHILLNGNGVPTTGVKVEILILDNKSDVPQDLQDFEYLGCVKLPSLGEMRYLFSKRKIK